jgi:hypothetical protein
MEAYGYSGGYFYSARPDFHAATAVSPRLESGNHDFEASFPGIDGGYMAGQRWQVVSVTTARLQVPAPGQEAAFVRDAVRPLVSAWAADGRLDTAYNHPPNLGKLRAGEPDPYDPSVVADEAAILKNVGWPLPYRSDAGHALLLVYKTGVVLRMRYSAPTGSETASGGMLSPEAAIDKLKAALRDPAARSVEEVTGRDYFIGAPYQGVFNPTPVGPFASVGPSYEFSDAAPWNALFDDSFAGKEVYWINANGWPGYGRGLVDARTGAVVRFTRTAENHSDALFMPTPFAP